MTNNHRQSSEEVCDRDSADTGGPESTQRHDPLQQAFKWLSSKNDTQVFAGLALLKSVIDNHTKTVEDTAWITQCWHAIPPSFLDRLLAAKNSVSLLDKHCMQEAQAKFELGVGVLHAFFSFMSRSNTNFMLPIGMSSKDQQRWKSRTENLTFGLEKSSPTTILEIMQILLSIASTPEGARTIYALKNSSNWEQILRLCPENTLVLDIAAQIFINIGTEPTNNHITQAIDKTLCVIFEAFAISGRELSMSWIYNFFISTKTEFKGDELPKWGALLSAQIHRSMKNDYNATMTEEYESMVLLSWLLTAAFPGFKWKLFDAGIKLKSDLRPACFVFTKHLLNDIQSTISSLQSSQSDEYLRSSTRVAASYDLWCSHLDFILEREVDYIASRNLEVSSKPILPVEPYSLISPVSYASIPAPLILELRDEIKKCLLVTIKYLGDRHDDIMPSSNSFRNLAEDHLTESQLDALCFWISNSDSGDIVCSTAVGIQDVIEGILGVTENARLQAICTALIEEIQQV